MARLNRGRFGVAARLAEALKPSWHELTLAGPCDQDHKNSDGPGCQLLAFLCGISDSIHKDGILIHFQSDITDICGHIHG